MAAQPPPPRREAPPSTTGDPFKDQWDQLRPQLRSWWDRLTEADLMAIDGQKDRLISLVQQRYGDPHVRAQEEVERRLREFGGRTAGVAATVTSAAQDVASRVAETAGTSAAQDVASRVAETAGTAATKAQEMAGAAASTVTDTVAGAAHLRPGARRADTAGRLGRAHPPPPRPGLADWAGDWLVAQPYPGEGPHD